MSRNVTYSYDCEEGNAWNALTDVAPFEVVSQFHCDKVADQIADAALDALLKEDVNSRTGLEVVVSQHSVLITGQVTSTTDPQRQRSMVEDAATAVLHDARYPVLPIRVELRPQSEAIRQSASGGVGDQAVCVGFATCETTELVAENQLIARSVVESIVRESECGNAIGRDGKIVVWKGAGSRRASIRWHTVHSPQDAEKAIIEIARNANIKEVTVNVGASFTEGSLEADTGVSGRKLAMDFYGTGVPIGGGALSGKDASKPDRTGNYAARAAACDLARDCNGWAIVWLVYSTGVDIPVTARFLQGSCGPKMRVGSLVPEEFAISNMSEVFGLRGAVLFRTLAAKGHFGRGYPWETPSQE